MNCRNFCSVFFLILLASISVSTTFAQAKKNRKKTTKGTAASTASNADYSGYKVFNIKTDFGAKGNGVASDQDAFEKASAAIKEIGSYVRLVIPSGTYIIGKQVHEGGLLFVGKTVIDLQKCHHVVIDAAPNTILKYKNGMKFGSFDPVTLKKHDGGGGFLKPEYAAVVGTAIFMRDCHHITVNNIALDGNNKNMELGGPYGDAGIQLTHFGIWCLNARQITLNQVEASHFCEDGMLISNDNAGEDDAKDSMRLNNCKFEYNYRQGVSVTGCRGLFVKNCKFNHTGSEGVCYPPGAGCDIEGEVGENKNLFFDNCEFINNKGVAMLADAGKPSKHATFRNCLFWGLDAWSTWVMWPDFNFYDCTMYGSTVWGHQAKTDADATKHIRCHFEDKPYKGKKAHGTFLIEINHRNRILYDHCTFEAHEAYPIWMDGSAGTPKEDLYKMYNCKITCHRKTFKHGYWSVIRLCRMKDNEFFIPDCKKLGCYYAGQESIDEGGNVFNVID